MPEISIVTACSSCPDQGSSPWHGCAGSLSCAGGAALCIQRCLAAPWALPTRCQ